MASALHSRGTRREFLRHSAAVVEDPLLRDSMVGLVSGEPSDFHCLLATCVLVSLDCLSTFLGLTCLDYSLRSIVLLPFPDVLN